MMRSLLIAVGLLVAGTALAAVPTIAPVEGVLQAAGGTAAADGAYDLKFALYLADVGGAAQWTEGPQRQLRQQAGKVPSRPWGAATPGPGA